MAKCKEADVIIASEGKEYALYKKGNLSRYPYMVDLSTGKIPYGEQRPLLQNFLLHHSIDVEPWETRTTHWCVRQAIDVCFNTPV